MYTYTYSIRTRLFPLKRRRRKGVEKGLRGGAPMEDDPPEWWSLLIINSGDSSPSKKKVQRRGTGHRSCWYKTEWIKENSSLFTHHLVMPLSHSCRWKRGHKLKQRVTLQGTCSPGLAGDESTYCPKKPKSCLEVMVYIIPLVTQWPLLLVHQLSLDHADSARFRPHLPRPG